MTGEGERGLRSGTEDLLPDHPFSAVSEDDDQAHCDQHEVVMPAVSAVLAPEAGFPDEDLFLDGAQHQQDEARSRELGENAEDHAQSARKFGCAKKDCEALALAD